MTDREDLIALVEAQPECRLYRDMLADWLMEYEDLHAAAAAAAVDKVASAAADASDLEQAAALLATATRNVQCLLRALAHEVGVPRRHVQAVVLTPGSSGPRLTGGPVEWLGGPGIVTVTVGASHVLAAYGDMLDHQRAMRAAGRRRAR